MAFLESFASRNFDETTIAEAEICASCFGKFEEYDSLCSQAANVQEFLATTFKSFQARLQEEFTDDFKCKACFLQAANIEELENHKCIVEVDNLFDFVEYTEETGAEESDESEGFTNVKYIKSETIRYTCNSCCEKFYKKKEYQAHLKIAHLPSTAELFTCSQCNEVCFSEMDLKLHIAVSHQKDEKFQCPVCNKILSARNLLVRHFGIHSSSTFRPHVCKFHQSISNLKLNNCSTS